MTPTHKVCPPLFHKDKRRLPRQMTGSRRDNSDFRAFCLQAKNGGHSRQKLLASGIEALRTIFPNMFASHLPLARSCDLEEEDGEENGVFVQPSKQPIFCPTAVPENGSRGVATREHRQISAPLSVLQLFLFITRYPHPFPLLPTKHWIRFPQHSWEN